VPTPEHRRSVHPGAPSGRAVILGRPPATVNDAVRSRLALIADVLIPSDDTMPSATEVGVAYALLDRVVAAVPSLAESLTSVLDSDVAEDDISSWLQELSEHDAAAHSSLLLAVAGAYYLHADVRRLLGYEGQVPQPVLASVFPDYAEEGLLDPVLANWAR
jgi:hypothetical protein